MRVADIGSHFCDNGWLCSHWPGALVFGHGFRAPAQSLFFLLGTCLCLPDAFTPILVIVERLHRTTKHFGDGFKKRLRFAIIDSTNISTALLLCLQKHLLDMLCVLLRGHMLLVVLHRFFLSRKLYTRMFWNIWL